MAVPSYTNTQRAEHLLEDFTKGTKRGRKRTDTVQHPPPGWEGQAGRPRTGTRPLNEGPSGQGEEPPAATGQIGLKPHHLGRHTRQPRPGARSRPTAPCFHGAGAGRSRAGGCCCRARDLSRAGPPGESGRNLPPNCAPSSRPSCLLIRNPARARCPPGGLPPAARARPHFPSPAHAARLFCCGRRPRLGVRTRQRGGAGGGGSHLVRGRELQLIDIEGRHQGDGVEAILQQRLLGALLREIVPQLHHRSGRPEAAACEGGPGGSHRELAGPQLGLRGGGVERARRSRPGAWAGGVPGPPPRGTGAPGSGAHRGRGGGAPGPGAGDPRGAPRPPLHHHRGAGRPRTAPRGGRLGPAGRTHPRRLAGLARSAQRASASAAPARSNGGGGAARGRAGEPSD